MKILIAEISEILEHIDKSTLESEFTSQKRNVEYSLGRFLAKCGARAFYGKDNAIISEKRKKPFIKFANFDFSISHSDNLAGVAFDDTNVGLDIEKIKPRNLAKLAKRYGENFEDEIAFYKFWTSYEAQYKSGVENVKSFNFADYVFSVSAQNIDKIEMYGIKICTENFDLKNIDFSEIEIEKIIF